MRNTPGSVQKSNYGTRSEVGQLQVLLSAWASATRRILGLGKGMPGEAPQLRLEQFAEVRCPPMGSGEPDPRSQVMELDLCGRPHKSSNVVELLMWHSVA